MGILENLNERLEIVDGDPAYGGEDAVKKVVETSPIPLPEDYIEFLKEISGERSDGEEILGPEFGVKDEGGSIWIFSAQRALVNREEFSHPAYDDIIGKIWLIGNDLGDLVYFYGEGKDGFGLYRDEAGGLGFKYADKIADTITDFLVHGIGIDTAITL